MKCIILFLFTIISLCHCNIDRLPEHMQAPARILHDTCQAATNAKEEDILNSVDGKIVNTPEIQCYVKCLLQRILLMDEEGNINFEGVRHMLTPELNERVDKVLSACETIHGKDICETAFLTVSCYFANDEKSHLI